MNHGPVLVLGFFGVDWGTYSSALFHAALRTLAFTAVGYSGAVVLGLVLALMRQSGVMLVRVLARCYTELFKNQPLLTTIFIIYFGLASAGIVLDTFQAGSLSLIIFYAAYLSEIFRGSLISVKGTQREAALAVGLTASAATRYVILPQAIRVALPGAGTMLVDLLKSTSLLVTIAGAELMTQGQIITSETFKALQVYVVIGAIYFLMCFPLSRIVALLERFNENGTPLTVGRRRLHRRIRDHLKASIAGA